MLSKKECLNMISDVYTALERAEEDNHALEYALEAAVCDNLSEPEKRLLNDAKEKLFRKCFCDYLAFITSQSTTFNQFIKGAVRELPDYMSVEQFCEMFDERLHELYDEAVSNYKDKSEKND